MRACAPMPKPGTPPIWMKLSLDRSGDEIRVSACSSRDEETAPRPLDKEWGAAAMLRFANAVRQAAARANPRAKPFSPALLADAQAAHRALLAREIEPLLAVLREAAGGALLV